MRLNQTRRREAPENTIPLINVVFLMLIFFLFAGSLARDDASRIKPPLNILEDETIRSSGALVIDLEGRTFAGEREMPVDEWLAQREQADPGAGPIKLAADGALKADTLEKVLSEFKAAGRSDIVLITRRGSQ